MPMYEYGCKECAATFDRLLRMDQDDSDVVCPHCGSDHIARKFSVFAAHCKDRSGAVTSVAGGGCCRSGGPGCGCASRN